MCGLAKAMRAAVDSLGRRAAFIASGDLSHRLKLGAPAGYDKDAHRFDEEVVAALHEGAPARVINIDQDLRRLAGECGYRSMLVAFGATAGLTPAPEVLHYEAPFGVGYVVAQLVASILRQGGLAKPRFGPKGAVGFRNQRRTHGPGPSHGGGVCQRTGLIDPPDSSDVLDQRAACFVSIKTKEGDLRGCIGTTEPTKEHARRRIDRQRD